MLPEFDCPDDKCQINVDRDNEKKDRLPHLHIAPTFSMGASINPDKPGAGLLDSFESRCGLKFPMTTDYNIARTLGCSDDSVTWAINLAKKAAGGVPMGPLPSMRSLLNHKKMTDLFGEQHAWAAMMNDAKEGHRHVWLEGANLIVSSRLGTVEPLAHVATYK